LTERVTVVVPAFGVRTTLASAVRSAVHAGADEVLIVDDASVDGSADVARDLASEFSQVRVLRNERSVGPAGTRNRGLREATGTAILFLDGDDELLAEALRDLSTRFDSNVVGVFGRFVAVDADGRDLDIGTWAKEQLRPVVRRGGSFIASPEGFSAEALVTRLVVPPPSGVLVRTSAARAVGGYDETLARSEDLDFLVRLSYLGALVALNHEVVRYRRTPQQRSQASCARRRGRQWTLLHLIRRAPTARTRWALARGSAAHHLDRAVSRWRAAPHDLPTTGAVLRSFVLAIFFRTWGLVVAPLPTRSHHSINGDSSIDKRGRG